MSISASRPLRRATITDIVKRLTDAATHYQETAVTALGWGMGPAQYGITDAALAAEAAGLITVRTWRGKQAARIVERPTLQVGPYTVTLVALPEGGHFAYGVDVHRPMTEHEAFLDGLPEGTPTLADQLGAHDLDQAVTGYLDLIAECTARAAQAADTTTAA